MYLYENSVMTYCSVGWYMEIDSQVFMHKVRIFYCVYKFSFNQRVFGALKWYKPAWLGFLDSVPHTLTGIELQSQSCQQTSLDTFLSLTGTIKMGSTSPLKMYLLCTNPSMLFLLEFSPWKTSGGKNSVVLLLPALEVRYEQETDMLVAEQVPRIQTKFSGNWWKPKSALKKSHLHCLDPPSSHSLSAERCATGHNKCSPFYSAKMLI